MTRILIGDDEILAEIMPERLEAAVRTVRVGPDADRGAPLDGPEAPPVGSMLARRVARVDDSADRTERSPPLHVFASC